MDPRKKIRPGPALLTRRGLPFWGAEESCSAHGRPRTLRLTATDRYIIFLCACQIWRPELPCGDSCGRKVKSLLTKNSFQASWMAVFCSHVSGPIINIVPLSETFLLHIICAILLGGTPGGCWNCPTSWPRHRGRCACQNQSQHVPETCPPCVRSTGPQLP